MWFSYFSVAVIKKQNKTLQYKKSLFWRSFRRGYNPYVCVCVCCPSSNFLPFCNLLEECYKLLMTFFCSVTKSPCNCFYVRIYYSGKTEYIFPGYSHSYLICNMNTFYNYYLCGKRFFFLLAPLA